jgi:hypothetical protein
VDFVAVVDQAIALLRQRGRLTYRTLQGIVKLLPKTIHLCRNKRTIADIVPSRTLVFSPSRCAQLSSERRPPAGIFINLTMPR